MQRNTRTNTPSPNRTVGSQTKTLQSTRTSSGQIRSTSSQTNRTANSQLNRPASSQSISQPRGAVNQSSANQKGSSPPPIMQKPQKDRLGQAVVSLIFGILGIILFFFSLIGLNFALSYNYTPSPGTVLTIIFAFLFNIVGFILGIVARRSSKGRGIAIAGITLTAIPLTIMTVFFLFTLLMVNRLYG